MPTSRSKAVVQLDVPSGEQSVDRVTKILFAIVDRHYDALQARKKLKNANPPHANGLLSVVKEPIDKKRTHAKGSRRK